MILAAPEAGRYLTAEALLRERSAFSYRKSVPYVAGRLGVSRYTVYKYLDELSGEDGPEGPL